MNNIPHMVLVDDFSPLERLVGSWAEELREFAEAKDALACAEREMVAACEGLPGWISRWKSPAVQDAWSAFVRDVRAANDENSKRNADYAEAVRLAERSASGDPSAVPVPIAVLPDAGAVMRYHEAVRPMLEETSRFCEKAAAVEAAKVRLAQAEAAEKSARTDALAVLQRMARRIPEIDASIDAVRRYYDETKAAAVAGLKAQEDALEARRRELGL